MKKLNLYILFLLVVSTLAKGQDISVTAGFDTSRIFIGDHVGFSVTISQPADIHLPFPFFKDTLIKNIEILSGPAVDTTILPENKLRIRSRYLVTSFDSGLYRIDPVFVELKNDQGIKRFYSDYPVLEVHRVKMTPPDTVTKIFDIVKPYGAPVTLTEMLPWILALIAAALIVWLLLKYFKKFRRVKKEVAEPVIREPAHVIAFRDLEILRGEKLWQSGETKKYYTRLTEIARKYLENRFGVFSMELTTSETLNALVRTGFKKDESYNLIKSVLNEADLVKFAKYKPDADENEASFRDSWNFVMATKKEEQVASVPDINDKKKESGL